MVDQDSSVKLLQLQREAQASAPQGSYVLKALQTPSRLQRVCEQESTFSRCIYTTLSSTHLVPCFFVIDFSGHFAEYAGTVEAAACLPGYYAPTVQSTHCYPCPPGVYESLYLIKHLLVAALASICSHLSRQY